MKHLRLQSPRTVTVRNRIIGGPDPLICLPLVAADAATLLAQAQETAAMRPDLIEWRVDKFEAVAATDAMLSHLARLRQILADIPLIFTCRKSTEGGFQQIDSDTRLALLQAAAATGYLDLIDTEISNGVDWIDELRQSCRQPQVALILSYHNFETTPAESFLIDRLMEAQTLGADIAKIAVMPRDFKDALTLLSATCKARSEAVDIPMIAVAMEAHGALTRIVGALLGSDITFAAGSTGSAPGQIPIAALKKAWSALGIRTDFEDSPT